MIPILFGENETAFTSNGLGSLSDATRCIVTEERNGSYELEMEYAEGGAHFEDIKVSRIIYAKPAQLTGPQPFRIYKITKPLNKRVQIYAQHISYQLTHIPVTPFTAQSASQAVSGLMSNAVGTNPFTMQTNLSVISTFAPQAPASFRNMIGGMEGSLLDVYGGELEWDKYTVKLLASRGTDRGLTLRYGKNITDINQEETIEATITGVMPYLKDQNGVMLYLNPKVVESSTASNFPYPRNVSLDMAGYVDERAIREAHPTATEAQIETLLKAAMQTAAEAYISANDIGVPKVSINVEYVNLGATEEYKDIEGIFAQAALCDTVKVIFERLGISTTAKIVRTEYNVLLERFDNITIGSIRPTLGGTIANLQEQADRNTESVEHIGTDIMGEVLDDIATAVEAATEAITGANGGYVKINYDANNKPYEILIMDNQDQTQAVKVWRWNLSGLAYSSNGYGGPYTAAFAYISDQSSPYYGQTIFNTDFIGAGAISGSKIKAGEITTSLLGVKAVTAAKIDDKTITATQINDKAVTATQIADSTITTTQLSSGVNSSLTKADTANNVTQIIYKTAVAGTTTMAAPSAWVTDSTGSQGTWTTKRPPYDTAETSPKVVCFTAIQAKDMSGTVTCTTPQIDETTTIIDGGHIITNSITASKLAADAIQANMITGQLTDSQIASLAASKVSGQLTNSQISDLAASKVSGQLTNSQIESLDGTKLSNQINTGSIGWIKLSDGTFSLAGGKFYYTNGQYIELLNNLSLRLNGIPLAGQDITADITAAHKYITFSYLKVIKTPYMIYVYLKGYIPALDPSEQQEIIDLPTTANTPDNIGVVFGEANGANYRVASGIMVKNTNTEATLYANSGGSYFSAAFSYYI